MGENTDKSDSALKMVWIMLNPFKLASDGCFRGICDSLPRQIILDSTRNTQGGLFEGTSVSSINLSNLVT